MTEQDKSTLIKDLCARLPYGVKVEIVDCYTDKLSAFDINYKGQTLVNYENCVEGVKPYLFPLSSMTEEQKREYYDICRQDWIDNKSKDIGETEVLYKGADWLYAHHFDFRGLIDKGLAIDATNLNIY